MDIETHTKGWPSSLAPVGAGFDREPFEKWWPRVSHLLGHLDPLIVEQWVHRHWGHTPYGGISLDALSYEQLQWSTRRILDDVHVHGWDLEPLHDKMAFLEAHRLSSDGHPTVRAFQQNGTWDFPIVVLRTPCEGLSIDGTPVPAGRHLLIEGHSRMRYLNALEHLGPPPCHAELQREHSIFLLSPQIPSGELSSTER